MASSPRHYLMASLAVALCFMGLREQPLSAQPKKGEPIAASPQAPTITQLSTTGGQRGKSVDVRVVGTNLGDAVSLWTSFPAKATIPADAAKDKDATKARFQLDIPADTPLGLHSLRVVTKYGISNQKVFCVDELPQIAEVETNHAKTTAQPVPIPGVVMGRADVEMSDYFKIDVKSGERLTFEVIGRRLGSAFDPIVLLHESKSGRELPGLYSDDAPGLQSDARFTHTFKEGGEYIVEVRDTTHRGGVDYFYRLRICDCPAAMAAVPIALKRGSKAQVAFTGPSVEGVSPVEVAAPTDPHKSVIYVAPKSKGSVGSAVPVLLTDYDELAETEPNNEVAKANKLPVPGGVTGRFQEKGDLDYFVFAAKKGTKYTIAAETYEINSPAEVYLILKNAKNAELGKSVPTAPQARIEYTATEDGDLFIHAEHLNYAHGPNEVYHLTVRTAEPDFDVNLGLDRFDVTPGGANLIPITGVVRRDYTGPIELTVTGVPGLSGSTTLAATVGAGPPPKDGTPATVLGYLPLIAKSDLAPGAYAIKVQAKGNANGKEVVRLANVTDLVKQGMAALPFPPREMWTSIGVAVNDKPVFSIAAKGDKLQVVRGTPSNVTVVATRDKDVTGDITLTALALPANVTATVKPIGKGTNDVTVQLTAAANAAPGDYTLFLRGTAKAGARDFAYHSGPIAFSVKAEEKKEEKKDPKTDPKKDDKKDPKKDDKKDPKKDEKKDKK